MTVRASTLPSSKRQRFLMEPVLARDSAVGGHIILRSASDRMDAAARRLGVDSLHKARASETLTTVIERVASSRPIRDVYSG
jgi:hypothetical protein